MAGGVCDDPYAMETQRDDLRKVVEWVAAQAWCSSVVLHGFSWGGTAALRLAAADDCPAAVKAIAICHGNDDLYTSDVFFDGGVPLLFNVGWAVQFAMFMARPPTEGDIDTRREAWKQRCQRVGNLPATYLNANDPSLEYWQQQSVRCLGYDKIKVPILTAAGLLGGYCDAALRLATSATPPVRCLLGPWTHALPHLSAVGPRRDWIGE